MSNINWQTMTEAERIVWLQEQKQGIDILTVGEYQRSQQMDYQRFAPQWECVRIQEVDTVHHRGIMNNDRTGWISLESIWDVRPHQPIDEGYLTVHPYSGLRGHASSRAARLQDLIEDVFGLYTQHVGTEYEFTYDDTDEHTPGTLLISAIETIKVLGFSRQQLMDAWDNRTV